MNKRIFLSPPHMGGGELQYIHDTFHSNYIAPVGPQIVAFEKEFAKMVGAKFAMAVSSGTAALHLLLRYIGIGPGDEVICSTLTFVATANPVLYCGGVPVFIDSEWNSWNMDPTLLALELEKRAEHGRLPKAVILVHLYGQPADIDPIKQTCDYYGIKLIEDAAETLGATYKGRASGTYGLAGIYSFNGNKIITTAGGGMIVSNDEQLVLKVKFWATQARDEGLHYEHSEVGYNYRLSNVLAAIGRGQLQVLNERVKQKRRIFQKYYNELGDLPGVNFMPELSYTQSSRWLTCLTINPHKTDVSRDHVISELEKNNIESRPTWKPMHMQKLFKGFQVVDRGVSKQIFQRGLCLPSGTAMTDADMERVISIIRRCWN